MIKRMVVSKASLVALICLFVLSSGCNPAGDSPPQSRHQPTPRLTLGPDPPVTFLPQPTVGEWAIEEWSGDEACAPPCWKGIVPGGTSADQVVRILDDLLSEGEIEGYLKLADAHYRAELPSDVAVNIGLCDGQVSHLRMNYRGPYGPRLYQVIERFGEPEALGPSRGLTWTGACPRDGWDDRLYNTAPSTGIYLLYPSEGVTVRLMVPTGYSGRVCPLMRVVVLIFYPPRSLEQVLQEEGSVAFDGADWNQNDLIPWPGYGMDD